MRRLTTYSPPAIAVEEEVIDKPVDGGVPAQEPPVDAPVVDAPAAIVEPPLETADDGEEPTNADSAETSMIEASDAAVDVSALTDQIETTAEVQEALEGLAEALGHDKSVKLNSYAAEAIQCSVDLLCRRAGVSKVPNVALETASEQIVAAAKKIWAAIVAALTKALEWAEQFWEQISLSNERLLKRALKLHAASKTIEKKTEEVQLFHNARLAKALHVKGEESVVKTADRAMQLGQHVKASSGYAFRNTAKDLLAQLAAPTATMIANFELLPMRTTDMKEVTSPVAAGFDEPARGLAVYRTEELPGGKALISYAPRSDLKGDDAVFAMSDIRIFVGPYDPKRTNEEVSDELRALEPSEINRICEIAVVISTNVLQIKEQSGVTRNVKKELLKQARVKENNPAYLNLRLGTPREMENQRTLQQTARILRGYARLSDMVETVAGAYLMSTTKSLLDYAELSMNVHKKAKNALAVAA